MVAPSSTSRLVPSVPATSDEGRLIEAVGGMPLVSNGR